MIWLVECARLALIVAFVLAAWVLLAFVAQNVHVALVP